MTKIEHMSEGERQSWITFLADGAVLIWFWQKMTAGFSPQVIEQDMGHFSGTVLGLIIVTIILHAVIAAIFEIRKGKDADETDERDLQIERKGAHWGYRLLQWGLGGVVVMIFLHHSFGESYAPPFSIQTPVEIIFALLVVSYVADLAKHGLMILAYRR